MMVIPDYVEMYDAVLRCTRKSCPSNDIFHVVGKGMESPQKSQRHRVYSIFYSIDP